MVNELFVPSAQQTSVLCFRLLDFIIVESAIKKWKNLKVTKPSILPHNNDFEVKVGESSHTLFVCQSIIQVFMVIMYSKNTETKSLLGI